MARVLVADDDPPIRQMVRLVCEWAGHEVTETVDAATAIEAYGRVHPDVLVLDIEMPGGGGYEVLRNLRFGGTRKIAPVLVVSGSAAASADEIKQSMNVERVLLKPFRIKELISAINDLAKLPKPPTTSA